MRVHVILLTFLAVSGLTLGAPSTQAEHGRSEAEDNTKLRSEAAAAASAAAASSSSSAAGDFYRKSPFMNLHPVPGTNDVEVASLSGDNHVYISANKGSLESVYGFLYKLYEKIKGMLESVGIGGGKPVGGYYAAVPPTGPGRHVAAPPYGAAVPGAHAPAAGKADMAINGDDLRNLYAVLYVVYNMVQQNGAGAGVAGIIPGGQPLQQQPQQQQPQQQQQFPMPYQNQPVFGGPQRPNNNPSFYPPQSNNVYASASATAGNRPSITRKRSYGSTLSDRDVDILRKVARKTVTNILAKLEAMLIEEERVRNEEVEKELNPAAVVVKPVDVVEAVVAEDESKVNDEA